MVTHKTLLTPLLLASLTTFSLLSMDLVVEKPDATYDVSHQAVLRALYEGDEDEFDATDELEATPVSKKNGVNSTQVIVSPDAPTQQLTTQEKMQHLLKRSKQNGKVEEPDSENDAKSKVLGAFFRFIRIEQTEDGCIKKMHELIEQGLNPDEADRDGKTALYHATLRNRVRVMQFLLDICCVDARRTFEGKTYMDVAIERNNIDAVRCLRLHIPLHIANGVGDGELPLIKALRLQRHEIVDVLLMPDLGFASFGQPIDRMSAYQLATTADDKLLVSRLKTINEQARKFDDERGERRVLELSQRVQERKVPTLQEKFEKENEQTMSPSVKTHNGSIVPRILGVAFLGVVGFIAYKIGQESKATPFEEELLRIFNRH